MAEKELKAELLTLFKEVCKVAGLKFKTYIRENEQTKDKDIHWHKLMNYILLKRNINLEPFVPLFNLGSRSGKGDFYDAINARLPYVKDGPTPLIFAIQQNKNELFEFLFRFVDVNVKGFANRSPLHYSAMEGHTNYLKTLLKAGIDIEIRSEDGYTPLHYAATYGHLKCIIILLKKGADIDAQSYAGDTALHFACTREHTDCVKILLKKGANREMTNKKGQNPREYMIKYQHLMFKGKFEEILQLLKDYK